MNGTPEKQTGPCQFCHPSLGVPSRAKQYHKEVGQDPLHMDRGPQRVSTVLNTRILAGRLSIVGWRLEHLNLTYSSLPCEGSAVFLLTVCSLFSKRACLLYVIDSHNLPETTCNAGCLPWFPILLLWFLCRDTLDHFSMTSYYLFSWLGDHTPQVMVWSAVETHACNE